MRNPESRTRESAQEDRWLERLLETSRGTARAPHGFALKVMDAVYKESLAGRSTRSFPSARATRFADAARAAGPTVGRMYRRLGLSFMLTAAILAASLFVPHGAYTSLVGGGTDAALGPGPSAAVQNALVGAGHAVQGALGEQLIGGNQE
jgi:hypothetical protein